MTKILAIDLGKFKSVTCLLETETNEAEFWTSSDALLQQVDAYARSARHRTSNPCLWLDLVSGKCKHHDVRPVLCRWFEPGCLACNQQRVKVGLPSLQSG